MQRNEETTGLTEKQTDDRCEKPVAVPYEPPRLIRVGSLRDLLGKTGDIADKGPPFELRE